MSRSPETGMELLLDLLCLDDGWAQRGFETPGEAARAIDRMTVAMRFFTLPDGRLACSQGGEESDPALVIAARVHDEPDAAGPSQQAPHAGYHRLVGQKIQVMVDVGKTAPSPWSVSSCAHTGARRPRVAGKGRETLGHGVGQHEQVRRRAEPLDAELTGRRRHDRLWPEIEPPKQGGRKRQTARHSGHRPTAHRPTAHLGAER